MWKRTPLHYAAREGQIEACQRLVELGGDLSAQDFLGRTPLHLAARKGHADLVVLLANLGSGALVVFPGTNTCAQQCIVKA